MGQYLKKGGSSGFRALSVKRMYQLYHELLQVVDHFQMEGKICHQSHGLSRSIGPHSLKNVKEAFSVHRLVIFGSIDYILLS